MLGLPKIFSLSTCLLWGFIIFDLTIQSSNGLRILGLFPMPVRSSYYMGEQLMRGLALKGHQVDVYSHFPLKNPPTNFKYFSLQGTIPIYTNNYTYQELSLIQSKSVELKYWFRNLGNTMCELMNLDLFQNLINNPPTDPPYDLVITDMLISPCYYAWGRHLNIPVIGVISFPTMGDYEFELSGNPLNLAVDVCTQCPYAAPMTFFEREENVYWNKMYTLKNFFGPNYPDTLTLAKEVSLILINHNQVIFGNKPFVPKVVPVGGLHILDRNEMLPKVIKEWLDESEHGCIYFTFGSMMRIETFPRQTLEVFYKAFKNIAPVRILMKISKPEELPPGLPLNVLTYHWFPQIQILKHKNTKAFMTHVGLMGTQESVYYGVPMIGFPLLFDQLSNIENYVRRKIAIKLDVHTLTESSLTWALNEIITNPMYKDEMQKVSEKFKDRAMKPIDTAVYWVEYISRHGKDSLQYSTVDMPWWQVSLLDVYGFIGIVIFALVFISFNIINACIKLCRREHTIVKKKLE